MKILSRDTNKTRLSSFSQHGRLESRIEGNVLLNIAAGPFNAEIIDAI